MIVVVFRRGQEVGTLARGWECGSLLTGILFLATFASNPFACGAKLCRSLDLALLTECGMFPDNSLVCPIP